MVRPTAFAGAVLIILLAGFTAVSPVVFAQSGAQVTVSGVVVDAKTGAPLAAYVQIWTYTAEARAYNETKTQSDGKFSMSIAAGKGQLTAQAADGSHEYYSREIDFSSSQTVRVEMVPFPPKTAVLEGVVTNAATGRPIQGAAVFLGGYAYATTASGGGSAGSTEPAYPERTDAAPPSSVAPDSCCYRGGESAITDGNGRYRIASYPGTYQVTARADGFGWITRELTLTQDATTRGDFALDPVPPMDALITGYVTDAETGKPVAGAQVTSSNLEWGVYNSTWTDANGRYSIRTMPGYTQVWINGWARIEPAPMMARDLAIAPGEPYPDGGGGSTRNYYPWTDARTLASGANEVSIALKPKPEPTQILHGYVVDAQSGKALANAWVNVRNEDTGEWGSATTGPDGSYQIKVRAGWLVVEGGAEGHYPRSLAFGLGDAAQTRLDLVLQAGTPRYGCCVAYAESAGAPAAAYDSKATATSDAPASPTSARATGTGTYAGGAGNLGAYDGRAVTDPQVERAGAGDTVRVPAPTAALVAAAAVAAAFVVARRR